jgi:hypothetical protein
MGMDHSAYAIRKQNIHFLRFYNFGHLTFAERRMHEYLTLTIGSPAIVWSAGFSGSTRRCPGAVRDA